METSLELCFVSTYMWEASSITKSTGPGELGLDDLA
jgi:hypothetical protein